MDRVIKAIKNQAEPSKGELFLYGDIAETKWWSDDITPKEVIEAVTDLGNIDELTIYLNSNGGDVFAGVAIMNYLNSLGIAVNIVISALAASIASVIACGVNGKVGMYDTSMMMIHNPWTMCCGNSGELRARADELDKINDSTIVKTYLKRASIDEEQLRAEMNEEKWLDAQECLDRGLCDYIISDEDTTADFYKSKVLNSFKNTPKEKFKKQYKLENKNKEQEDVENLKLLVDLI